MVDFSVERGRIMQEGRLYPGCILKTSIRDAAIVSNMRGCFQFSALQTLEIGDKIATLTSCSDKCANPIQGRQQWIGITITPLIWMRKGSRPSKSWKKRPARPSSPIQHRRHRPVWTRRKNKKSRCLKKNYASDWLPTKRTNQIGHNSLVDTCGSSVSRSFLRGTFSCLAQDRILMKPFENNREVGVLIEYFRVDTRIRETVVDQMGDILDHFLPPAKIKVIASRF